MKTKILTHFALLYYAILLSQNIVTDSSSYRALQKDLTFLTNLELPRNYKNLSSLNKVADHIKQELIKVCDSVAFQSYKVKNQEYKNVVGSIGLNHKERIIIGAHYDVYGDSAGADDNASGVIGLLELARLLAKEKLKYRIDFVFYTLEEPPFFRTKNMGSYIHAKYLHDKKLRIKGMICLESIGYFSDNPNSQTYPIKELSSIYGTRGNYITVVQNNRKEKFSIKVSNLMIELKLIPTKLFIGSPKLTGVDFSDHLNYWKLGFEAVMITNTAFYRNQNYHTKKDTSETLDLKRLYLVVQQIQQTLLRM
ncbi:M28 family peptidase [Pseudotenacibaculum sp. MALMAid0570]|uniref:M28 family peptidase n=1 Tax=Pseudotenacibaculum sp. MALMAid0570 TaxID=3143938 RepID=UPI0032DF88D9